MPIRIDGEQRRDNRGSPPFDAGDYGPSSTCGISTLPRRSIHDRTGYFLRIRDAPGRRILGVSHERIVMNRKDKAVDSFEYVFGGALLWVVSAVVAAIMAVGLLGITAFQRVFDR